MQCDPLLHTPASLTACVPSNCGPKKTLYPSSCVYQVFCHTMGKVTCILRLSSHCQAVSILEHKMSGGPLPREMSWLVHQPRWSPVPLATWLSLSEWRFHPDASAHPTLHFILQASVPLALPSGSLQGSQAGAFRKSNYYSLSRMKMEEFLFQMESWSV